MNNLKEKIQENFISYHKELLQCFSEYIAFISMEYANIKAYCKLINKFLPCIENFFDYE